MKEIKKLYLSSIDRKLAGVCGGIAEYYELDSTLVRLIWAILTIVTCGLGVLAYIAAMFIIPNPLQD
jgi:phage shock protein C